MPRAKLSKESIEHIKFVKKGTQTQVHWDDSLPGFGLRVYETGARVYVVKYRLAGGHQVLDTLGPAELIPLEQAREAARRTLIKAYNERTNPFGNDRLIAEFCDEYIERFSKLHSQNWAAEDDLCRLYLKPQWSDRPISSLRKSDVAALINTVSGISPEMANQVKALISKLWECGQHWNYIDNALKNPTIDLPEIEILDVALTADDSERVLAAIETERDFFVRAAMLVLLVSSLHKSEVIDARWEQIDWTTKTISVERHGAKQKRLFTLPLSEPAYAILESLPKHPGNPYVFCGKERGLPIDDFDERWERVRALAGIKQIKLQGLRAAVASSIAVSGSGTKRAMKVLGYRT